MKKIITLLFIVIITMPGMSHSGRTYSNGGHTNRSTGVYHYHNSGKSSISSISKSFTSSTTSYNHSIKMVQESLKYLGYYRGVSSGILNDETKRSIISFKKDNKLPGTSIRDTFFAEKLSHKLKEKLVVGLH